MTPDVEIYDTTLRDGTQGHGISFSVADKLRIAERLDAFGVHYIEGGWPGSNPKDIEFFAEAKHRTFKHARLAAFGSTRRKDVAAAADDQVQLLIAAATPVVTIFGKTSPLHVREVLQTTLDENLAMIADTVRFLKQHGKFVVYDAEHCFDGFKEDTPYALATLHAAEEAGADVVTLCDTNGGSLPADIAAITRAGARGADARGSASTRTTTSGSASPTRSPRSRPAPRTCRARSTATASAPATATSPSVMPILHFKLNKRGVPAESLPLLTELSQFVDETANLRPNPRLPWVGAVGVLAQGRHARERGRRRC